VSDVQTHSAIDVRIAALAARQHGVVSRRQLLALGLKSGAIGSRVRARRLAPLYRGVYAVGHAQLRPEGFRLAAVLAVGPDAVLSHRSAGAVWGLRSWSGVHELTVRNANGREDRATDGLRIHRCVTLRDDEVTRLDGIPITTVARTLVDLAALLRDHELRRAIESAEQQGMFDLRKVERVLSHHPGMPGTPRVRRLLEEFRAHGVTLTRSDLESRMLQLCLAHGLPRPQVNRHRDGREVDFRWPAHRLVVETDGWATHRIRRACEADRGRDRRLAVEGWRSIRVTHRQVRDEPAAIAADLRILLT
jgi:very-short-patch-repair endonuclease